MVETAPPSMVSAGNIGQRVMQRLRVGVHHTGILLDYFRLL